MTLHFGLAGKLTAIFSVFAALIVASLSSFVFFSGRQALVETTLSKLHSETLEKETALRAWIFERQREIGTIAHSIQTGAVAYRMAPEDLDLAPSEPPDGYDAGYHSDVLRLLAERSSFHKFMVLDPVSAEVVASTDPAELGAFKEDRDYFRQGRNDTRLYGPYYSAAQQGPALTASSPLRDNGGGLTGVLVGRIMTKELNRIVALRSGRHETDDAYLVNASSLLITQPRLIENDAVLQREVHTPAMDRCLSGTSGSEIGMDFQEVPVIAVYRWLADRQACLVGRISQEEAFRPVRNLALATVSGGGIALFLAGVTAIFLARRMTQPIRDLQAGAAALSKGDFDVAIATDRNDELGELSREFDAMAAALKKRTKALSDSEALFRSFIEQSPGLLSAKGNDGRYTMVSPRFREILGLGDEVIGKRARDIYPADLAELFETADREIVDKGAVISRTIAHPAPGSPITLGMIKFPLLDGEGKHVGIGTIGIDITERERAEKKIKALNRDLEERVERRTAELQVAQRELLRNERLATLGQLTATVSHELRNPLGAMRTSSHILRKAFGEDKPQVKRAIERLDRSITRCDRIIDELLDFTRISDLEPQPIVLDAWLSDLLDEFRMPAGVILERGLGLGELEVPMDPDRLRRAVINVWENACQAMAEPKAALLAEQPKPLRISTGRRNKGVEIRIEDSGPGIPDDVRPRIFEPLFSTKNFGVGLGLSIVKQILDQHLGEVKIDNREGGGTCFSLWIPLEPSPLSEAPPQWDRVSPMSGSKL